MDATAGDVAVGLYSGLDMWMQWICQRYAGPAGVFRVIEWAVTVQCQSSMHSRVAPRSLMIGLPQGLLERPVDQDEGDPTHTVRPVRPGVIGAALNDDVARLAEDLPLVHDQIYFP